MTSRYLGSKFRDHNNLMGKLSNDDGDGNENGKKVTTLHVHLAFLYIS